MFNFQQDSYQLMEPLP